MAWSCKSYHKQLKKVGKGAHRFPAPKNWESGAAENRQGLDITGGGVVAGISRDAVSGHLNLPHTGDVGSVGGASPYLLSIKKV